jgi:hypothetical protein
MTLLEILRLTTIIGWSNVVLENDFNVVVDAIQARAGQNRSKPFVPARPKPKSIFGSVKLGSTGQSVGNFGYLRVNAVGFGWVIQARR